MSSFSSKLCLLAKTTISALSTSHKLTAVRYLHVRRRWMRPFLKDLYNRRVMAGPEPLVSRSAMDNWNYTSEIFAFSHRLGIPELDRESIVKALTNKSFFERKDVEEGALYAQPSMEGETKQVMKNESNEDLREKGEALFRHIVLSYLRAHWPVAPEEFIIAVAMHLASNGALNQIVNHLGIQHLVRTGEFPPSEETLQYALLALLASMDVTKARNFIRNFVLPRLCEVPIEDVLPFQQPFYILRDYMNKWENVVDIEPRFINSGGLSTAMPYYEIAIYANKDRILGQCNLIFFLNVFLLIAAGEQPWVALDMASQNALLRIWKVLDEPRVFPFKFEQIYESRFDKAQKANHSLKDILSEDTDDRLYSPEELAQDPLDPLDMARFYQNKVNPELGFPHRKRLRHLFSYGSIMRRPRRTMVKPQPHNI